MTLQRFYHTQRHCYIVADVIDAGAKAHVVPATGNEALWHERLPLQRGRRPVAQVAAFAYDATVHDLIAAEPMTLVQIAQAISAPPTTILRALQRVGARPVGSVTIRGRERELWGIL